ncbi:MAG: tetratricopeptide repeat protein [Flavobacteriales bacterium]|nr:tetratricopeptide repeat protein [Flavobacteriales bacterium]
MKLIVHKSFFISLSMMLLSFTAMGQFGNKGVFLIDSVRYGELGQYDKELLDSVLPIYHTAGHDTTKLKLIGLLADGLYDGNLWPRYNQFLYDESLELHQNRYDSKTWKRIMSFRSSAINNFGFLAYQQGRIDEALVFFEKSNRIQKSIEYWLGYAHSLNNLGTVYRNIGEMDKALSRYEESAKICLEILDTIAAIQSINNIGEVF